MRKLIWLIEILLVLLIVVFALLFLDRNESLVQLDLLVYQTGELGVGTLVLLAFIFGALLGIVVRIPDAIWLGVKNRLLPNKKKQSSHAGKELSAKGSGKAT